MVLEIAFDREVAIKRIVGVLFERDALTAETLFPFLGRAVGHHAEFPGEPLTDDRWILGIVVAVIPLLILDDHFPLQRTDRDCERRCASRRGNGKQLVAHAGMAHAESERAHAAHRRSDRRVDFFDSQVLADLVAAFGNVFERQHWKAETITFPGLGVDACGTRRAETAAEGVNANDEVTIGIQWQTGSDHVFPPPGRRIVRRRCSVRGRG